MTNPFINAHAPLLWASLLPEFGRVVSYWPGGDEGNSQDVEVIWVEGMEDDEYSPGRYSHALIQNSDTPAPPAKGDSLEREGQVYDVVRVNAFAYGFSRVIVKERSGWLR